MNRVPFPSLARSLLLVTVCGGITLAASVFLGLSGGSSGISFTSLWYLMTASAPGEGVTAAIIWDIRLPRVILAAATGSTLAISGLVFQALLRNPLSEPYILGLSGGAAVGALIGMLLGFASFPGITILAFFGGFSSLFLVVAIARHRSEREENTLLLGGVMVNAFCGALIMLMLALSKDTQLRSAVFWLMGDLSQADFRKLPLLLLLLPAMTILFLNARSLNLLLLGRDSAAAFGINIRSFTYMALGLTSFMVGMVVSQTGLIGFVGLVVPHVFRLIVGSDHRLLMPLCLFGGGSFLILCDLFARTLPPQGEIPVGILTALIGAPLFICLLWKAKT